MDHDAVLLTQSGVEKLKQEKEQLINVLDTLTPREEKVLRLSEAF